MEIGLGIIGWTPQVFWKATHHELNRALDGWQEANGVQQEEHMTREKLEEMMERFPDGT